MIEAIRDLVIFLGLEYQKLGFLITLWMKKLFLMSIPVLSCVI